METPSTPGQTPYRALASALVLESCSNALYTRATTRSDRILQCEGARRCVITLESMLRNPPRSQTTSQPRVIQTQTNLYMYRRGTCPTQPAHPPISATTVMRLLAWQGFSISLSKMCKPHSILRAACRAHNQGAHFPSFSHEPGLTGAQTLAGTGQLLLLLSVGRKPLSGLPLCLATPELSDCVGWVPRSPFLFSSCLVRSTE